MIDSLFQYESIIFKKYVNQSYLLFLHRLVQTPLLHVRRLPVHVPRMNKNVFKLIRTVHFLFFSFTNNPEKIIGKRKRGHEWSSVNKKKQVSQHPTTISSTFTIHIISRLYSTIHTEYRLVVSS